MTNICFDVIIWPTQTTPLDNVIFELSLVGKFGIPLATFPKKVLNSNFDPPNDAL